jgi:adhesin transport system outer membrane protein
MKYDFYSGGADKARAQQGAFKAARAAFEFDLIARQFERSLSEIRSQVKNGEEVKQARIRAAKASASSMRSINEQFKFNRGSLLDVLKTQEEVYSAGKELVDSVADQIIAKYRLMHLVSQIDVFFGLSQVRSDDIISLGGALDKKGVTRGPLE